MARGTQFLPMITRLRDELRLSNSVAVGVDDLPALKQSLNRAYVEQYKDFDWPHLNKIFTKKTLNAGQQYYDLPSGLNYERIDNVVVWYNNLAHDVTRGIGFDEYNIYDTAEDERSDPVQNWDIRWTGSSDQFEVWPLPATEQFMQFEGFQSISRLVNDIDTCLLDDDLVILTAASRLHKNEKRRAELRAEVAETLRRIKANSKGGEKVHRLGLGHTEMNKVTRATVRVS